MSAAENPIYGLVGEFAEPASAIETARHLHREGFRRFDVYSPLPLEELEELLPARPRVWLALIMFVGALVSLGLAFFMQYAIAVLFYPLNVGGRPLGSWPAFVPSAWEICAFSTVYIGFIAFIAFCHLPKLYHPIFNAPRFERASQDRIFVSVASDDPLFDSGRVIAIFRDCRAASIAEVPP
ncbi:MAG TPA: DUF3341 domain-containing protein [Stellaceae bacterium]|jgi:hypothetical protein|nr:DUF3341 domain-containing protein [Stellaceae bacterium]